MAEREYAKVCQEDSDSRTLLFEILSFSLVVFFRDEPLLPEAGEIIPFLDHPRLCLRFLNLGFSGCFQLTPQGFCSGRDDFSNRSRFFNSLHFYGAVSGPDHSSANPTSIGTNTLPIIHRFDIGEIPWGCQAEGDGGNRPIRKLIFGTGSLSINGMKQIEPITKQRDQKDPS